MYEHHQAGAHAELHLERRLKELSVLTRDLERLDAELETITSQLAAFNVRVQRAVAPIQQRIDEARIEFVEAVLSRNVGRGQSEVESTEGRHHATDRSSTPSVRSLAGGIAEEDQTERVRSLYRRLVKLVHPDLTTDVAGREVRTRFMRLVNEAYEQGDPVELGRLMDDWDSYPESVRGTGPTADLLRIEKGISLVRQRVRDVGAEIATVKASKAYASLQEAIALGLERYLARLVLSLERELAELDSNLTEVTNRPSFNPGPSHG